MQNEINPTFRRLALEFIRVHQQHLGGGGDKPKAGSKEAKAADMGMAEILEAICYPSPKTFCCEVDMRSTCEVD